MIPKPARDSREFRGLRWLDADTLHTGGLVPANLTRFKFACPSVYVKSGWVAQRLTSWEIARAYNLPVTLEWQFRAVPVTDLPFLGSTPLKLLHSCAVAVRDLLSVQGGVVKVTPRLSQVGILESGPCLQIGNGNANNEGSICDDPEVSISSQVPVAAEEITPEAAEENVVTPQTSGLTSAAKRDDAEVPVELWDDFILE